MWRSHSFWNRSNVGNRLPAEHLVGNQRLWHPKKTRIVTFHTKSICPCWTNRHIPVGAGELQPYGSRRTPAQSLWSPAATSWTALDANVYILKVWNKTWSMHTQHFGMHCLWHPQKYCKVTVHMRFNGPCWTSSQIPVGATGLHPHWSQRSLAYIHWSYATTL